MDLRHGGADGLRVKRFDKGWLLPYNCYSCIKCKGRAGTSGPLHIG